MKNNSFQNLASAVIDASVSNEWSSAVREWEIIGFEEDVDCSQTCVCGHDGLRYLFTIKNKFNGKVIYPIGSICIKKFERDELNEGVKVRLQALQLMQEAAKLGKDVRVNIKSGYFTSDLILYMFTDGAFKTGPHPLESGVGTMNRLERVFFKRKPSNEDLKEADEIIKEHVYPWLRKLWRETHPPKKR